MKAVGITEVKKAEMMDVPAPAARHGQVLIQTKTCLLCTWEQRIFDNGAGMSLPFIPGHEASGIIAEIPEGMITSFKVGDRVVYKTLDDCGHCSSCYQGFNNLCSGTPEKRNYGGIGSSGGLGELIAVNVSNVFPVGKDISFQEAAFSEPLACCVHSIGRVSPELGETIVIIGAGIMGMLHMKLALLKGCRVIMVEPREDRRKLAEKEGAHFSVDPVNEDAQEIIRSLTDGEGAEYVFFTAARSSIAAESFKYLKKMGTIVYYGSFHPNEPIPIDPNGIHYGEYVITGSYSPSTKDFYTASRLLARGIIDIKGFLSAQYSCDEAQKAFEKAIDPETFRVAINF
ncbi:MAG: zinc-binding dehydrogenase [Spirochaetales bacterium]|nr:zinc-binding dehydrogenase [Spirochaetales bacterium]